MKNPNIVGKIVVITGASSGIGEDAALLLAQHGAKIVLAARRKDRLDALVEKITAAGSEAVAFTVDVAKRAQVEGLVRGAIERFGGVDVIVNNAGIMPIAPISDLKVEEWEREIDVNLKGVLYGVAAVLPQMRKQNRGHIINVASVIGIKVFAPGGVVYGATKAAVRVLTEGLRVELHAHGIRTTIISPGAVATELPESSSEETTRKNLREFYRIAIPPDSIARAIAYAIEQPADVEINEIVIRPAAQEF